VLFARFRWKNLSREKTEFLVPGCGLYDFRSMPFDSSNAAQIQQRLMDKILGLGLEPRVFVYLDDIIVTSRTFAEHISLLEEVYKRLEETNLTVNLEKCKFSLNYLGFVVDRDGFRTDPEKISAMINYPVLTNTTQLKRFLGLCSCYRRYIPHLCSRRSWSL
jgi:hypothetical protein